MSAMDARHHFVLVSRRKDTADWLAHALKDEGELIVCDTSSLDRALQLIDAVGARLVLQELSSEQASQDAAFMEGLTEAKPLMPVIAVADTADRQTILTALRAGARDFISPEIRPSELVSLMRRSLSREQHDARLSRGPEGAITTVASARPGADAPMFALHLALALQEGQRGQRVLLLDLGVPAADTLHYLGITPTYTFVDAIRSLRRLDDTLIDTAFASHASGMKLLAMPEDDASVSHFTSADLFVLLGTLRRHFTHIVVNLGGVPASDFLYVLLGRSERTMLLVEQSVPSCKQNRALLQKLRDNKVNLEHISLVVDRYLGSVPPSADTIAKGFGIPLLSTLPPSGMARLTMMNSGESLFKSAPRDPYTLTVRKLAQGIAKESGGKAAERSEPGGSLLGQWVQRLRKA
jgi:pilus assembly protein CpaE